MPRAVDSSLAHLGEASSTTRSHGGDEPNREPEPVRDGPHPVSNVPSCYATTPSVGGPRRIIKVNLPIVTDDGNVRDFIGYRVSTPRCAVRRRRASGSPAGRSGRSEGTRRSHDVEVRPRRHPLWWRQRGIECDPATVSRHERSHVVRRYMTAVGDTVGPHTDRRVGEFLPGLHGDRDDRLAAGVTAGDVVHGRRGFGERVRSVDDGSELAVFDERGEVDQVLSANR